MHDPNPNPNPDLGWFRCDLLKEVQLTDNIKFAPQVKVDKLYQYSIVVVQLFHFHFC